MSTCVPASPCRPSPLIPNLPQSHQQPHLSCILPIGGSRIHTRSLKPAANALTYSRYGLVLKHTTYGPSMKYQKGAPVCLLGGKDKSEGDKKGFPWSFDKVMENFKGKSVEDVLRQQIKKQEFYDGGSGKNPPPGGGGGSSSSGRDGFGESEDEGLSGILDETMQVVLATIGFIFLYVYIISGEELTRLAKDYIKFLLKGSISVRLKRAMYRWKRFYQRLTEKKEIDKFWLERAIINTPTAYDSPKKYRQIFKTMSEAASKTDE